MIAGHDEVSDVYGPRVYFNVLCSGNTNSPTQAVTVFKLKLCSDFPLCHLLARLPDGGSPAILTYGDLVLDPSRTPSYYGMKTGRSNVVTLQYREVRPEERIRTEGAIDAQYEKLISPRSDGVDQSMSSTTRDVGLHNQQIASPSSDLVWELVALRNEVATMTRERNALYQRLAQSQVMQSGPNEPLSTSRWGQDVAPYNVQCIARTQNWQKVQLRPRASGHGNRSNHVTPPPPMGSHRPVGYIRHILHDVEPSLIEVIQEVPETESCLPHSIEQRKPDLLEGIDYNRTDSQRPVPHSVFDRGDPANADYSDPPYRESYAMLLEAHRHIVALQRERDRLRRRVRVHEGKRTGRHSRDPSRREDWDPKQTNNSRTTPPDIVPPSYPVSSAKRRWAGVAAANVFLGPLRRGSTSKRAVKTSSTEMNHSIQTNRAGWNEKTHTSQPGDTKMRGMASVARFISHLKHGIDKKRAGAIENDRDHKYNRSQRQDPGYEVQNAAREQDGTDEIYESTLTRERDDRDESEVHASEGSEDQDEETGEEAGEYIGGEGPDEEEEEEEEEALEFHERIPSKRHGMTAHSSIRDPESTLGGQSSSMKAAKPILRR